MTPLPFAPAAPPASSATVELETGAAWVGRNVVQIPRSDAGDRFSLSTLTGRGPIDGVTRVQVFVPRSENRGWRVLLAPLGVAGTGTFAQPVRFAGQTFAADAPTRGRYQFNSWRATFRERKVHRDRLDLWVGATLKIREAQIKLTQNGVSASDQNVGFVPLAYAAAEYRLSPRWSLRADIDGLAVPGAPGRAVDAGLKLTWNAPDGTYFGVGVRTLEGGADIPRLYNFAWINYALVTVGRRL